MYAVGTRVCILTHVVHLRGRFTNEWAFPRIRFAGRRIFFTDHIPPSFATSVSYIYPPCIVVCASFFLIHLEALNVISRVNYGYFSVHMDRPLKAS